MLLILILIVVLVNFSDSSVSNNYDQRSVSIDNLERSDTRAYHDPRWKRFAFVDEKPDEEKSMEIKYPENDDTASIDEDYEPEDRGSDDNSVQLGSRFGGHNRGRGRYRGHHHRGPPFGHRHGGPGPDMRHPPPPFMDSSEMFPGPHHPHHPHFPPPHNFGPHQGTHRGSHRGPHGRPHHARPHHGGCGHGNNGMGGSEEYGYDSNEEGSNEEPFHPITKKPTEHTTPYLPDIDVRFGGT